MSSYTDIRGRRVTIEVTGGTIRRVRAALGINVLDIAESQTDASKKFHSDPVFMCDVLWEVARESAKETGITDPTQFADGLSGNSLDDAVSALIEAIINFTPSQRMRDVRLNLWHKAKSAVDRMMERSVEAMNHPEIDAIMDAAVMSHIATCSNAAPSSESIPSE